MPSVCGSKNEKTKTTKKGERKYWVRPILSTMFSWCYITPGMYNKRVWRGQVSKEDSVASLNGTVPSEASFSTGRRNTCACTVARPYGLVDARQASQVSKETILFVCPQYIDGREKSLSAAAAFGPGVVQRTCDSCADDTSSVGDDSVTRGLWCTLRMRPTTRLPALVGHFFCRW